MDDIVAILLSTTVCTSLKRKLYIHQWAWKHLKLSCKINNIKKISQRFHFNIAVLRKQEALAHVIPPVTSKKSDQRASYDANFICGCQVMINPCNCHNNLLTNKPLSITNCHWFTKPGPQIWYTYGATISRNKSARPVHLLRVSISVNQKTPARSVYS